MSIISIVVFILFFKINIVSAEETSTYAIAKITNVYRYDDGSVLSTNKGDLVEIVNMQEDLTQVICNNKKYQIPTKDIDPILIEELPENFIEKIDRFNKINTMINFAYQQLNKPYKWSSTGPDSYDCSGLTKIIYKQIEYNLSRSSYTQTREGVKVEIKDLSIGDLIFFNINTNNGHVGIYVGNNTILHASLSEGGTLTNLKFMPSISGIRRYI